MPDAQQTMYEREDIEQFVLVTGSLKPVCAAWNGPWRGSTLIAPRGVNTSGPVNDLVIAGNLEERGVRVGTNLEIEPALVGELSLRPNRRHPGNVAYGRSPPRLSVALGIMRVAPRALTFQPFNLPRSEISTGLNPGGGSGISLEGGGRCHFPTWEYYCSTDG